ncbi:tetratricopeptide repeat protein, partial [Candidatus Parcubacteria bacterium]|nr:tetratricopeptide repeat protein [Candidatus Parcubacteria bacterium]
VPSGLGWQGAGPAVQEPARSRWLAAARWLMTAAFALGPFIFLPFTSAPVDFNKEAIFITLVLGALLAWLGDAFATGVVRYRASSLHWGVAAVVGTGVLATFFSIAPVQSLANIGLSHESLIGIAALGLFAFLFTAVFRSAGEVRRAFQWLIAAAAVYGLFNLVQLTGNFFLPWSFAKNVNFTGTGGQNYLAIVFGAVFVLLVALVARPQTNEARPAALTRFGYGVAALILFLNIFAINLRWVWVGLVVAMAALAAFWLGRVAQQHAVSPSGQPLRPKGLTLPVAILAFSVLLVLFRVPILRGFIDLPVEVSPAYGVSLSVANRALSERGPAGLILGTGPGTFAYAYNQFRPQALNSTAFWGTRFEQSRSALTNVLVGEGYAGVMAWVGFMALFALAAIRALYRSQSTEQPEVALGAFGATVFLLATWFLYPSNLAVSIILFGLLGAFAFFERSEAHARADRSWQIYSTPHRALGLSLFIILLMIGTVAGGYLEAQRYLSGVYYGWGSERLNTEKNPNRTLTDLLRAVEFWGAEPAYYRTLAQAFLTQASQTISSYQPATEDLNAARSALQTSIQNAVSAGQRATQLNPADSQNWMALGLVYENVVPLVPGSEGQARSAYETVNKLDPNNPTARLFIARTAVSTADRIANQIQSLRSNPQAAEQVRSMETERTAILESAKNFLEEAITLKPDFGPAHFLLVQVYDRQGDLPNAIGRAAALAQAVPGDSGLWFQLGFLYYKSSDLASAQAAFERAVGLDGRFSNARYFLGLIYDKNNEQDKAIEQFEQVQALNPGNAEVKAILANLKAGQGALAGIAPPGPTPEQRTEAPVEERGGAPKEPLEQR